MFLFTRCPFLVKASAGLKNTNQIGHRPSHIVSFTGGSVVHLSTVLDLLCSRGAAKWALVSLSDALYVSSVSLQQTAHLSKNFSHKNTHK